VINLNIFGGIMKTCLLEDLRVGPVILPEGTPMEEVQYILDYVFNVKHDKNQQEKHAELQKKISKFNRLDIARAARTSGTSSD
jgi:hypothetical protein